MYYYTKFYLTKPVNDYEEARNYLLSDTMEDYFEGDYLKSIDWILLDNSSGVVCIETEKELTKQQKEKISTFIKNQNSDGLGEGFSQQPFADLGQEISEFDWRTNDYLIMKGMYV